MKQFIDFGIEIGSRSEGNVKAFCPNCHSSRKNKGDRSLSVDIEQGIWNCHNCQWSGSLFTKNGEVYGKPTPVIESAVISGDWQQWLFKRGISTDTALRTGVVSQQEFMPQVAKKVEALVFQYKKNGRVVNAKYRDLEKNFKMTAKAERTLYGYDDISQDCLVWVEGEIDKISFAEAGIMSCVSVPDGAPKPDAKNLDKKFDYFATVAERLLSVQKHIIAVDSDEPGKRLQSELIRRLSPEKCFILRWPSDCKDANDMLVKHGKAALAEIVREAAPVPVQGIFTVSDAYENLIELYAGGVIGGFYSGFENMRELFSVRLGDFTVITGIPNHGKSEWLDNLLINMAKGHGFKSCYFSPENQPLELHIKKLAEKWCGRPFFEKNNDRMTVAELNNTCGHLENFFSWLLPEEGSLENILSLAKIEILRKGINLLVVDPWNEIEHSRPSSMTESEYIGDCLRKMRIFARKHNVHLFVVAHPTKLQKRRDNPQQYEIPTPYDISGSANWRNKADNCITVYRESDHTSVYVQKIRVKEVGKIGAARFKYKLSTGEYFPISQGG